MVSEQAEMTTFDLDRAIDQMHAEASRRTGLHDFGPADYRKPLAMLATHLGSDAFNTVGREEYREELIVALVGRLVREDTWKKHPDHASRTIARPLVICGIPRTGTTVLHKLLSVDPQFQGLDNWLTSWPISRPPRAEWDDIQGFRDARARLDHFFDLVPELRVSHEMVADEVDECLQVLRLDFVAYSYPASYDLPDYDVWFQAQDERPLYRRLADTIRLIGLHDDRTWLLKNPGHVAQMEALLDAFPDARVIITHRDPVKAIPSLCSVLSGMRRMLYRDPDLKKLGPREIAYWAGAKRRSDAVRQQYAPDQFLDIDHRDFHRDPMGTVRGIYAHFGLELTQGTEQAMLAWLAANPAGKHGEHRYELADYGITKAQIKNAFGAEG